MQCWYECSQIQTIRQSTLFLVHFKQENISVHIQYYKVFILILKKCVCMHANVYEVHAAALKSPHKSKGDYSRKITRHTYNCQTGDAFLLLLRKDAPF